MLKNTNNNIFSSYIHGQVNEGLGKIGVILSLETNITSDKIENLGKQIAMHIAASKPMAISSDNVDPEVIERERSNIVTKEESTYKEIPGHFKPPNKIIYGFKPLSTKTSNQINPSNNVSPWKGVSSHQKNIQGPDSYHIKHKVDQSQISSSDSFLDKISNLLQPLANILLG